jgi:rhamnose transport system permease protein
VAINGGSGTVYGAALGALLLGTISSALVILKINPFWNLAINGLLLLVAIALDQLLSRRISGLLRQRSGRRAG